MQPRGRQAARPAHLAVSDRAAKVSMRAHHPGAAGLRNGATGQAGAAAQLQQQALHVTSPGPGLS